MSGVFSPADRKIPWAELVSPKQEALFNLDPIRDAVARAEHMRAELDQLRMLMIDISRELHTGDLPADLHQALDDYVAIIGPLYPVDTTSR
ncbi:hypothetical protein [Pseudomonas paralcaligenes]|uniref:hypothetical protein n=1 Tax=Pseudomonas paralcaligenes TaxID=2772558 RepID=UPI001C820003|nr:hypothetical protein [Pseudomonas paralcaligenes]